MADKNIQMTQRNAANTGWDNLFPITTLGNIIGGATIVERGGDANGNYVKFNDGTMICYITINRNITLPTQQNYWISPFYTWTYPIPFVGSTPSLVANNPHYAGGATGYSQAWASSVTFASYGFSCAANGVTAIDSFSMLAIGRWK